MAACLTVLSGSARCCQKNYNCHGTHTKLVPNFEFVFQSLRFMKYINCRQCFGSGSGSGRIRIIGPDPDPLKETLIWIQVPKKLC